MDSQPLLAFMGQAESLTGFLGGVGLWDNLCFGCIFWLPWGWVFDVFFVCFCDGFGMACVWFCYFCDCFYLTVLEEL